MRILIVGTGRQAYYLCRDLMSKGHTVVIVSECARDAHWLARRLKATVVCGNGSDPTVLEDAGVRDADVVMTLKNYYRRRPQPIAEAEERGIPVYVLRSNTVIQIQESLAGLFAIPFAPADPFADAMNEAEEAIQQVVKGVRVVELSPEAHDEAEIAARCKRHQRRKYFEAVGRLAVEQILQHGALEDAVVLGQDALQGLERGLDGLHGRDQRLAQVAVLRQAEDVVVPGDLR